MKNRRDRPGYQRGAKRADGSCPHYWNPRRAVRGAPLTLEIIRFPDDASEALLVYECQRRTAELKECLLADAAQTRFDGTVQSLVRCYRTDDSSPYHALKHSTRKGDYDPALKLIESTVGKRAIHMLKGSDFRRWFEKWGEPEADGKERRPRRAQGAMKLLRIVFSFGAAERLPGCSQAREILSLMEFKAPKARGEKMTYVHAKAIVEAAIERRRPSIALTQAIQWATALRRINVIGEWLPLRPGDEPSGIVRGRTRWTGPTVKDLSSDLVFSLEATAKGGAGTSFDLKEDDLVMLALKHYRIPDMGPLIISEVTGMPYRENKYANDWREVADAAGVPRNIWSMDTRAGAISEAEEVAGIEAARKMAKHTTSKTTARYVRNDPLESNREIAKRRSKLRE